MFRLGKTAKRSALLGFVLVVATAAILGRIWLDCRI